ncbi:dephospho-CoA kinase [Buchananella hordeovulneris]|uniref:dephospho-CoA kinase n=1 Tax=Buchananella hordeovulneris TaxID=52770 RepID=UPI000A03C142|nr:dephospho-CoA kinase [Buchananella hordeovulneris]MDO5081303.1 dephospho-CoA kinase [Buchananella hordeovulneris]
MAAHRGHHRGRIYLIGLTGGIGSGKSTVAQLCAQRGARVVSADELARRVVEPGSEALAQLARQFGGQLLLADGSLDRAALGQRIFADPQARRRVEKLLHPRIQAMAKHAFASAPTGATVIYDIPLLVEAADAADFDEVCVVEAPLEVRLARLADRGLDRAAALARIEQQASDEERRALADVIIDNSGNLEQLARQVEPHLQRWRQRAHALLARTPER